MAKQFWLVKQEPNAYSWDQFVKDKGTDWTGIRNYQARNHVRAMKKGDRVLFYHSVSGKCVVGIAEVSKEFFPDETATEGDWSAVTLIPIKPFKKTVSLAEIKADDELQEVALIRHTRLSVMPLKKEEYQRILALGETR